MIGRLLSMLGRLSPSARVLAIATAGLVTLSIVVSALTPASHPEHWTRGTSAGAAGRSIPTTAGVQEQRSPVSAAGLTRAREVATTFLESYLPFVYGRAPARCVTAITPALRGQLTREHAQPTPVELHRHPNLVSLQAVGTAPGVVLATALIDDGGIATYPLRLTVQRQAGGWLVSSVDRG